MKKAFNMTDMKQKAKTFVANHRALSLLVVVGVGAAASTGIAVGIAAAAIDANRFRMEVISDNAIRVEGSKAHNDYSGTKLNSSKDLQDKHARRIKISTVAADAVDKMMAILNSQTDYSWHATGSPMTDAINAVRFAIKQSAQASSTAASENPMRDLIKTFTSEVFVSDFAQAGTDNSYQTRAFVTINEWLKGVRQYPVISQHMDADWEKTPYPQVDLTKTKALRLQTGMMQFAEYRTNQIEWLGNFDAHKSGATQKLAQKDGAEARGNKYAPNIMILEDYRADSYAAENFIFNFDASSDSDVRTQTTGKSSRMTVYEAMCTAISTLYDAADGSHTNGHRKNLYDPNQDVLGYSQVVNSLAGSSYGSPYIFTETRGENAFADHTDAAYASRVQELAWVKRIWGTEGDQLIDYIIYHNMSQFDFMRWYAKINMGMGGGPLVEQDWMTDFNSKVANMKTPADVFNFSLGRIGSWGGGMFNYDGKVTDVKPTTPATLSSTTASMVTSYKKAGFDYTDAKNFNFGDDGHGQKTSYTVGEFDLLGTETFSTHLDGAEPSATFKQWLVRDGNTF